MTLVPETVKHTSTFCQILRPLASVGYAFLVEQAVTRAILDIIGRVSLRGTLRL